MTEEESKALMLKQDQYYKENWHRALLSILRYKHPTVANADQYALLSLKQTQNEPIFFSVGFMKPGKNTYYVERKDVGGGSNEDANEGFF